MEDAMATAFILIGSLLGLGGGVAGYLVFDVPLAAALAIWIGAGPLSALLALAAASRPARHAATNRPVGEAA